MSCGIIHKLQAGGDSFTLGLGAPGFGYWTGIIIYYVYRNMHYCAVVMDCLPIEI